MGNYGQVLQKVPMTVHSTLNKAIPNKPGP